jgi:hypothetical protein
MDYYQSSQLLNKCKNIAENYLPYELKTKYIDSLIHNTEQVLESKLLDTEFSNNSSDLNDDFLQKYNKFIKLDDKIK